MGAIVTPQVTFEMGREWYATRLNPDWERATAADAEAVFGRHGLTGEFWSLA